MGELFGFFRSTLSRLTYYRMATAWCCCGRTPCSMRSCIELLTLKPLKATGPSVSRFSHIFTQFSLRGASDPQTAMGHHDVVSWQHWPGQARTPARTSTLSFPIKPRQYQSSGGFVRRCLVNAIAASKRDQWAELCFATRQSMLEMALQLHVRCQSLRQ